MDEKGGSKTWPESPNENSDNNLISRSDACIFPPQAKTRGGPRGGRVSEGREDTPRGRKGGRKWYE